MIKTLLKWNMKSNWGMFLMVSVLMLIYSVTSLSTYDYENMEALLSMMDVMPQGLMNAMGFDELTSDLTFFLGAFLYGFILLVFPLIYTVTTGIRLVASQVDSGAIAYMLTTPHTRIKLMITQAVFHMVSTVALLLLQVAILIGLSLALFPGRLEVGPFLMLNLVTMMVVLISAGITFLVSCIFSEARIAIMLGSGIPVLSFMLRMVSEIGEPFEKVRYFSYYALVVPERIYSDGAYVMWVILGSGTLVIALYWLGIWIFNRKSLTI